MLKLSTSYSKKVPVQGQDFSSQSYHCAVELELSDNLTPEALRDQIHETFDLVKQSVESELGDRPAESQPKPLALPNGNHAGNGNGGKATNKQVKYIIDLAKERGMGLSDVNAQVKSQFGVGSVYALDRKAASLMVEQLKAA